MDVLLRHRRRWTAMLCLPALASCASIPRSPTPEAPQSTVSGAIASSIDEHLRRAERLGFAGAVLISRDGEIVLHKGYGLADREAERQVTTATVFDIGSITKQFTAAAILRLEEMGRLKVTDSIGRFFPGVPPDKRGITLHHLLTHSSGLAGDFGGDYEPISRDSIVRVILASELEAPPGARYQYSNAGYSMLGALVEMLSGQGYEQFLRTELFAKAGLTSTGYRMVEGMPGRLAVGYRGAQRWGSPLDRAWDTDGPFWHLRANGGILSTTGDMHQWVRALQTATVLSDSSRVKLFTPWVREGESSSFYAYGWAVDRTPRETTRIGHNGGNGYFFADLIDYRDERVIVVFLTNEAANEAVERDILRLAFGETVAPLPVTIEPPSPAQLALYAGRYRFEDGTELEVRASGRTLDIPVTDLKLATLFFPALSMTHQARVSGIDTITTRVVAGMASGDFTAFRRHFRPIPGYAADGEVEFWTGAFGRFANAVGPFRESRVLGTSLGPSRQGEALMTYVEARFERGSRVLRFVQLADGSQPGFFVQALPLNALPDRHLLAAASGREFVSHNFRLGHGGRVTFETDGARVVAMEIGGRRAVRLQ